MSACDAGSADKQAAGKQQGHAWAWKASRLRDSYSLILLSIRFCVCASSNCM